MPPPAKKQGKTSPQWCRPGVNTSPEAFLPPAAIGEIRGVRPISPHITTSVSSSRPRCCEVVEEAAQAAVERRQQLALQIAEGVLVRVPAAQVDLHHPHAGLDQPPGDQEALAPLLAAVEVADRGPAPGVRSNGLLLARAVVASSSRSACWRWASQASSAGRSARRRRGWSASSRASSVGAVVELRRARRSAAPRSGRWKSGSRQLLLSHQAFGPVPGGAGRVVRVVVAEAVGARAGRRRARGTAARDRRPSGRSAARACRGRGPDSVMRFARGSSTTAGRPTPGSRRQRRRRSASRSTATRTGPGAGWRSWRWCRPAAARSCRCAAGTWQLLCSLRNCAVRRVVHRADDARTGRPARPAAAGTRRSGRPAAASASMPYSPRMPSGASGLGSNVSCCDGPPDWKMKTTDLARLPARRARRSGLGFQPQQVGEPRPNRLSPPRAKELAAVDLRVVGGPASVVWHESRSRARPCGHSWGNADERRGPPFPGIADDGESGKAY